MSVNTMECLLIEEKEADVFRKQGLVVGNIKTYVWLLVT